MKILLYDTKYFFNERYHEKLEAKGVELLRVYDLSDLEQTLQSGKFDGLLSHPGMQNQREFMQFIAKLPNLKVGIISDEPGVYDEVKSEDLSVFSVTATDAIYNYFAQPKK